MFGFWRHLCVLLSVLIGLSGCKQYNRYQPLSESGYSGYNNTRIDEHTVRVSYHGSYGNSNERVEDYLLYRCAQVTKQYGFDYFVIVSSSSQPVVTSTTSPALINTYSRKGDESYGIITPGQTTYFQRSIASKVIKMYRGKKANQSSMTYNANEVIRYMKPGIQN